MAKINGIENMSGTELSLELQKGGRFVVYEYCVSLLVITFFRSSNITFVKADENKVVKGLGFTFLTLLLGWWGIPWGPIRSIQALVTNFKGGKDVTANVIAAMKQAAQKNNAPS
jgi:hypothetical protein